LAPRVVPTPNRSGKEPSSQGRQKAPKKARVLTDLDKETSEGAVKERKNQLGGSFSFPKKTTQP
jgi:hypothetical protein